MVSLDLFSLLRFSRSPLSRCVSSLFLKIPLGHISFKGTRKCPEKQTEAGKRRERHLDRKKRGKKGEMKQIFTFYGGDQENVVGKISPRE